MSGSKRSVTPRQLLLSLLVGALIAAASSIAYVNSGQEMPFVANIAVSMIALAVFPGYILSAYLTNNIHDASLIIAAFINCALYSAVCLYLMVLKNRRNPDQSS
jgi:hypothetical protein